MGNDLALDLECEILKTFYEKNYGRENRLVLEAILWRKNGKVVGQPKLQLSEVYFSEYHRKEIRKAKAFGLNDLEWIIQNMNLIEPHLRLTHSEKSELAESMLASDNGPLFKKQTVGDDDNYLPLAGDPRGPTKSDDPEDQPNWDEMDIPF